MEASDRNVGCKEMLKIVGVSRVTAWRWEKQGCFPRRRKIGPGRVAWLHSELMAWLHSREVVEIGNGSCAANKGVEQ